MPDIDEAAEMRRAHLDALAAEREGYVRSGKVDRVAQVDQQIARLTGTATAAPKVTRRKG